MLTTDDEVLKERVRQARWSFNLSLLMAAASTVIGLGGVVLLMAEKIPAGVLTTSGGATSSYVCFRVAKDANDRLDRLVAESKGKAEK